MADCLLVAVLRGDANVKGTVTFEQASESAPTTISYDIQGNDPSAEVRYTQLFWILRKGRGQTG